MEMMMIVMMRMRIIMRVMTMIERVELWSRGGWIKAQTSV